MGNKSSKARARSSAATAAAANAEPVSARDLGARDLGARARDLAKPAFVRDFAIPDRLGGMTAATISAVGAAVQTWNSAKDNSTVHGLIAFVTNAVPAFAATLGALGEHAPLVGVVFSVLKVAGAYVADVAATKAAYETFAAAVITTTRLVLEVEEFQRAEQATLPGPVTSALNLYWAQLDTFAALLVQFRGKNYAKRLFGKGAHQTQLNVVRIATEQAARDLDRTGILTSVVQNELILGNQAAAKQQLDAVAKKQDRALELQEASSGKLDKVLEVHEKLLVGAAPGRVWTIASSAAGGAGGSAFVGRATELAALQTALHPSGVRTAATRVVISGMGGTGKSTLAQRAAAVAAARFTSGWTLDGSKEEALLAGLVAVARDLKLGELKQDEIASAVQARLSKADVAGWLIVVDNVDDAAFKAKLPALLPSVGGCLLVTSRLADWDGWTLVALGKLSDAEATQLLGGSSAATTDAAAPIATVVKQLDGLAVALEQARAYVERVKIPWAKYVDKLQAQAAKGVLPSLQLSLKAALEQDPAVGVVLQLLQVLHPDAVPRTLLSRALDKVAPPGADADELLALLGGFSIVTFTAETVSLHRLMQEAMRAVAPCSAPTAAALSAAMDALVDEGQQTDFPLMRALLVQYEPVLAALERLSPGSAAVGAAWHAVGTIHVYSFHSDAAAQAALERALAVQEALFGPDDVSVAMTLFRLGLAVSGLGDAQRHRDLTERALEINERHYGPDHPEVAATLTSLATAYAAPSATPARRRRSSSAPWPSTSAATARTTPRWPSRSPASATRTAPSATTPRRRRSSSALWPSTSAPMGRTTQRSRSF